jgi:tRNA threonylcarbamoyladenosine biosynthesis protein TsaE
LSRNGGDSAPDAAPDAAPGPSAGPGASTVIESGGPEETAAAGRKLAAELRRGDVVLFEGEVGAGKSTMIRSAMRELGIEGAIPSPTFTIGRLYRGRDPVSHLDLYRLGSIEDEDPGLLAEYLGPDRIVFVEWPGPAGPGLAATAVRSFTVSLEHRGGDRRRIEIALTLPAG